MSATVISQRRESKDWFDLFLDLMAWVVKQVGGKVKEFTRWLEEEGILTFVTDVIECTGLTLVNFVSLLVKGETRVEYCY